MTRSIRMAGFLVVASVLALPLMAADGPAKIPADYKGEPA